MEKKKKIVQKSGLETWNDSFLGQIVTDMYLMADKTLYLLKCSDIFTKIEKHFVNCKNYQRKGNDMPIMNFWCGILFI